MEMGSGQWHELFNSDPQPGVFLEIRVFCACLKILCETFRQSSFYDKTVFFDQKN